MCGPLVAFLGRHPFRFYYFIGRLLSFSLVGMISGEMGILTTALLKKIQIPALFSLSIGCMIVTFGIFSLLEYAYPGQKLLAKASGKLSISLGRQLSQKSPWPLFLFGFCTIALPCGQTVVVFSAIACMQGAWQGLCHGFLFALLTSPSLFLAMHGFRKIHHRKWMGIAMLMVGILFILRALADIGLIEHFGKSHLVLY